MIGTTTRRLMGVALLTALLAACGTSTVTGPPAVAPAPAAPAPDGAKSETPGYLLETPEFSVGFPEEPVTGSQDVPGLTGLTASTYTVDRGDHALVMAVIDYPADVALGDPTTVLEGARDGALANVPGSSLTSSTPTEVDGRPAVDVVASVEGGAYRALIVLDGQRLYQLITVGSSDRTSEHEQFASSLRLLT